METLGCRYFKAIFFITLIGLLVHGTQARAQVQGQFDTTRLENEIIFDVPLEDADRVWQWMQETFRSNWPSSRRVFTTFQDTEQFIDTYFDTPERSLMSRQIGLRHRRRVYPDGKIKELIQMKQPVARDDGQPSADAQTRGELKFELKNPTLTFDGGNSEFSDEDLLRMVKNIHRPLLVARLEELGIRADRVRPLITLRQERRRIYFRDGGNQYFTMTLDLASAKEFGFAGKFAQLDIEIGEIAFTDATRGLREELLTLQGELQTKLLGQFPNLQRNQTPKVVQMIRVLEAQGFGTIFMLRYGITGLLVVALLILTSLVFFGPIWRR